MINRGKQDLSPTGRIPLDGQPHDRDPKKQEPIHPARGRIPIVPGKEGRAERDHAKGHEIGEVESDHRPVRIPNQPEQVPVPRRGDGNDHEADQKGHEARPQLTAHVTKRLTVGEIGHMNLEDEQRRDDRESSIAQCEYALDRWRPLPDRRRN